MFAVVFHFAQSLQNDTHVQISWCCFSPVETKLLANPEVSLCLENWWKHFIQTRSFLLLYLTQQNKKMQSFWAIQIQYLCLHVWELHSQCIRVPEKATSPLSAMDAFHWRGNNTRRGNESVTRAGELFFPRRTIIILTLHSLCDPLIYVLLNTDTCADKTLLVLRVSFVLLWGVVMNSRFSPGRVSFGSLQAT